MIIRHTLLPGVMVVELKAYTDNRGFFCEIFREEFYQKHNLPTQFVQFNHSRSSKHALRGLHYQRQYPQGKLLSVMRGAILDVAADVNPDSPTFGQWVAEELSDKNHYQLYVPPGYAHGFLTLSDEVDLLYGCTDYYHPEDSFTVNWNDPTLNIEWSIKNPILSENDAEAPFLSELTKDQLPLSIKQ